MMKHLMLAANIARMQKPVQGLLPAQSLFRFASGSNKNPQDEIEAALVQKEKEQFEKISAKDKLFY